MRLAWCTPLAKRSGISKYSLTVLPALSRLADVTVFTTPTIDDYDCKLPVASLENINDATQKLREFDAVVFNSGNNPAFHTQIHRAYERVPGIVVIHDKRMHGFFHDLWAVIGRDPARYAAMMRYYYGPEGERAAAQILTRGAGVDTYDKYPLVEPALWNARGVIVHSEETAVLVRRYGDEVPIQTLGLPFDSGFLSQTGSHSKKAVPGSSDRLLLVSTGGVYEQKRIGRIIEAIAGDSELREALSFLVVGGGRPEYIERLSAQARESGIGNLVQFTGWVEDDEMYQWIEAADIAVNLRYPSTESASLSLVEQMYFGKPLIVTDTGCYAELPDDVAFKIRIEKEVDLLGSALRTLVRDTGLRSSMGTAARERALTLHNPERYAQSIIEFANSTGAADGSLT